jgi:hypothetical protein
LVDFGFNIVLSVHKVLRTASGQADADKNAEKDMDWMFFHKFTPLIQRFIPLYHKKAVKN